MEDIDAVPYAPVGVADPRLGDEVVAGTVTLRTVQLGVVTHRSSLPVTRCVSMSDRPAG